MNRCKRIGKRSRRSFTLVELLLALALSSVVAALTGSIAVHMTRVRDKVEETLGVLERKAQLLDGVALDLRRLLPDADSVRVSPDPHGLLELNALAASHAVDALHLPLHPATIRYRLHEQSTTFDLVREVVDRTAPDAKPRRETVATNLASCRVTVRVRDEWIEAFPHSSRSRLAPTALRVNLTWADGPTAERTFLLHHDR